MIGDLVLSKERIIKEAHEQKSHSHESQKNTNLMEKKEVELLGKLNIPNPYEERL